VIAFRGARLLLRDAIVESGTLVVDGRRIADVLPREISAQEVRDCTRLIVAPGFIDVHVHGIEGVDSLDDGAPIAEMSVRLPKYGVTGFCPTTVACGPDALERVLAAVDGARQAPARGARVLAAHLESNFINPDFRGAQPRACLRLPPVARAADDGDQGSITREGAAQQQAGARAIKPDDFTARDVLDVIDRRPGAAGIVTLAPELAGALDLIAALRRLHIRVSVGHSGASYEEAVAGLDAGITHATHLFNRMSPLHHRDPGVAGAVLDRGDVDAELICDGVHVHPASARLALRCKSVDGVLAITDATAGAGLPPGSRARLGGRAIAVRERAAFLEDGTLAGSTITMDAAFRVAVEAFGCSLVEAARLCATTPARALGLSDRGVLRAGAAADFVVLDERLRVIETWVDGICVWNGFHPGGKRRQP
jgi:N-acetylglucosamine-6-phosphate deacetylase